MIYKENEEEPQGETGEETVELGGNGPQHFEFQDQDQDQERIEENKQKVGELLELVKLTKLHEQTKEVLFNEELDKSSLEIKRVYKRMLESRLGATLCLRSLKVLFRCFKVLKSKWAGKQLNQAKQNILRRSMLLSVFSELRRKQSNREEQKLILKVCAKILEARISFIQMKHLGDAYRRIQTSRAYQGRVVKTADRVAAQPGRGYVAETQPFSYLGQRVHSSSTAPRETSICRVRNQYRPMSSSSSISSYSNKNAYPDPRINRPSALPQHSRNYREQLLPYRLRQTEQQPALARTAQLLRQNQRLRAENKQLRMRILASKQMLSI